LYGASQDFGSYPPDSVEIAILGDRKCSAESKNRRRLKKRVIKPHILKGVQRIVMYKILKRTLGGQIVLQLVQKVLFIKAVFVFLRHT
jgi:hypothetical protein